MATKKKLLQAAAGSAGGAGGLNVEEVFSTYVYEGTGAVRSINNGIDLDGEGGLVWFKTRSNAYDNELVDTERGAGYVLSSNQTYASTTQDVDHVTSFNSDGFTMGADNGCNYSGRTFASWTFRKAPKFFDVVTYTGNGTAGRTVSHNLGTDIGFMVIKQTSASGEPFFISFLFFKIKFLFNLKNFLSCQEV